MKKLLIVLLLALMPKMAMALETVNSVQELVDKTAGAGLSATVFTSPEGDVTWKQYKANIEAYEKKNKDIKFYLADVANPELAQFAMLLGISALPTTLFSENGEVLTGGAGAPATAEQLEAALGKIKAAVAALKEQRKLEQEQKKDEVPPAPMKRQEEGTIDYRPRQGLPFKVMNA